MADDGVGPTTNFDTRFRYNPDQMLVGVLDRGADLDALVAALAAEGVAAGEIEVLSGEDGVAQLDRAGKAHGLRARVARALQRAGSEGEHLAHADQALRDGHFVVAVPAPDDDDERHDRQAVLKRLGVSDVRYFGRWTSEAG